VRIGLVLGAGGSLGVAYHGAVLGTIEDVTGWDPRTAQVIVGTSAGSITGSMLRAGLTAGDLMSISESLPLSVQGRELAAIGRPHRPRPQPRHLLQVRPMADPLGVVHGVTHPHTHSPGALVAAVMPSGGIPTDVISAGIDAMYAGTWPLDALWLCAVDLRHGHRVVFGRPGCPAPTVGQAVAASCAIPGYFQPVAIGGRRYVDGGVWSMTNLDVLAEVGLDLVIVSAPMSQASIWPALTLDTFVRQSFRVRLRSEMVTLRRAGVPVVSIEPDRRVARAMGLNLMDARPRGAVSRATRARVTAWLAGHPEGQRLAAMLAAAAGAASGSGGDRVAGVAGEA
jgi:NTE family protein